MGVMMKGRKEFTQVESNQITQLINEKCTADTSTQKGIRAKIRKLGFHYSDFSNKKGYTVADFNELISNGEIKIVGHSVTKTNNHESNHLKIKQTQPKSSKQIIPEEDPFANAVFVSMDNLNPIISNQTGLYAIQLKPNSVLPQRYQVLFDTLTHRIIYIGKAESQTLRERLSQELYHKKAGTFFRSIGAVIGYTPIPGHLVDKANKNNYKFSKPHTQEIIKWLEKNVEVFIVAHSGNFSIEEALINKYTPLLNDTHNTRKCMELIEDREKCRRIARA